VTLEFTPEMLETIDCYRAARCADQLQTTGAELIKAFDIAINAYTALKLDVSNLQRGREIAHHEYYESDTRMDLIRIQSAIHGVASEGSDPHIDIVRSGYGDDRYWLYRDGIEVAAGSLDAVESARRLLA